MIIKRLMCFGKCLSLLLVVLTLILVGPGVLSVPPVQASGVGYELTLGIVAGGGERLENGIYSLEGTAAQIEAAPSLQSGGYIYNGGFWHAAFPIFSLYLPLTIK